MSELVTYSRDGDIGLVLVNNPPVNALSQGVRQGLLDCITQGAQDAGAKALVLLCEGRTFIAGADIREFGKPPMEPGLNAVLDAIEGCPKPVVAAIHGTALGGGLEVALACHWRVGVADSQYGFPEVKLGLLPGAAGTQRTPRLIGVEPALKMITSGDPVDAAEAHTLGLIDEVVSADLRAGALAFAARTAGQANALRKIRDLTDKIDQAKANPALFTDYRAQTAKRARGNEAPLRCIEAVEAAVKLPFDEGLAEERKLFVQALGSQQSAALRYVFFAEREAAKIPDIPKETQGIAVNQGAVLGSGTMGIGIAMNFANAGIAVRLIDVAEEPLKKALETIRRNYASTVSKGRLSQAEMDARVARISTTTDYEAVREVDLVIEAVFEEMGLKKEIFAKLDALCRPDAVMATNTSTLDVNEIASATSRPEQVLGMHFFSPANVMRLVEVVRGAKSSDQAIATAMATAKRMGKVGALVGVCHGFVGNRMLHQYSREAAFLLEEGATPQQVDKVLTAFGLPMGPFTMGDLAGLDVGWRIRKGLKANDALSGRYAGTIADRLCEAGRFGQKTNAGYYRYEPGSRTPLPDPEVEKVIRRASDDLGIDRREISDEEILARCLYPLINEGAKILEEKIALRASDIDTIWINGYGFPAHRGGPMFYADQIGLDTVHEGMLEFLIEHGEIWAPSPLLAKLASEGKGFTTA